MTLPYKDSSSDCYSSCHYEKKTGILECTEIDDNSKTPCFPPGKLQCTPPSTDVTKDRFDCAYTNTTGEIYTPWAWCNVVTRPVSSPVSPTVSPQYLTKDAKKLCDYEFAMYTLRQCMNDKEACVVNGYTLAANLIPQHAHFLGCYFDWVLPELWAIEELKPNNFVKDFANLVGATNWTYPRDLPVYDANLQCKSTCSFKMTKGSSPPTANLNCCALQDEQSSQDGLRVKSCFLEGQMKCHYVEQDASSRMCPSTHPKYKYVEGWSDVLQPQFYCRTSPSPGPNICEVPEVSKEYWDGYIEVRGVHFRVDMKGLDFGSKGETFRKLLQKCKSGTSKVLVFTKIKFEYRLPSGQGGVEV